MKRCRSLIRLVVACALMTLALHAQQPVSQSPSEVTSRTETVTFKSTVNLVLVPVVVRDAQGRYVSNLGRDDFELFDNGKPQIISRFVVEGSAGRQIPQAAALASDAQPAAEAVPENFIAYLFDDIHLSPSDLIYARDAAERHFATSLTPAVRAAVYSTSGRTGLDFTADRGLLHKALSAVQALPSTSLASTDCPPMSYYVADLIENKHNEFALAAAVADTRVCLNTPMTTEEAQAVARNAARRALVLGDQETRVSLGALRNVVRKMSTMPGRRTIVLVSPGFLTVTEALSDVTEAIERAIRTNVLVSALDARGLYTAAPDITQRTYSVQAVAARLAYDRASASAQADVMAELAYGTGGTFVQNTNDLDEGFRRASAVPDLVYVLGFSPQNLKLDGSYHKLRVTVKSAGRTTLQVRRGYYAPRYGTDPAQMVKQEIEEMFFSRDERSDFPIELNTQFFKTGEEDATLAVLAHLDLKQFPFRKAQERNLEDLTVVSGLFDENGNYRLGTQKVLELRLRDETLEKLVTSGITVRTDFSVKPGRYMIRLVVRDSEGQMLSARNAVIEIP
jgi:VWFA-related protein